MHIINARNVNDALWSGLQLLHAWGYQIPSRNGPVIRVDGPVVTEYTHPWERVLFDPDRDANPFFHLFEALWMIAGRNDVKYLTQFVKTFYQFSDNGTTLNGAYGHRWRHHFGFDQLSEVVRQLSQDPTTRRAVLTMWGASDLVIESKDKPCNTMVYFDIARDSTLAMTVLCRSNDIVWGAYGANAVHFSMLQEWVALMIGRAPGKMYQVSNNFHAYIERPDVQKLYILQKVPVHTIFGMYRPMMVDTGQWNTELKLFLDDHFARAEEYREPFFREIAVPMLRAHQDYKNGLTSMALKWATQVGDVAWGKAATEWILRRSK